MGIEWGQLIAKLSQFSMILGGKQNRAYAIPMTS